jgi:acyl-CoA dehydrogenase
MNFDDTAEEAAFRAMVRSWMEGNAPKHLESELRKAGFASSGIASEDPMAASKAWQKKKAAAGYACLHWPKEYGGGGFNPIERVIWGQEEGVYGALSGPFTIGHGMCGPTVMVWASEEQKRRLLPPLAAGEKIWCQLFSEPAGGSDLAGLRTRAECSADSSGDWIINGQKIWTSGAQHSDYGLLLTRTNPEAPKHQGLTMFFLDMRSSGIEIRPIKQANGQSGFNEVYFTDVRVPDAQRLGPVDEGWRVSLTTLMNERLSIGSGMPTGFPELFTYCMEAQIDGRAAIDDRLVRSRLATFATRSSGLKYTGMRAITALSKGETPGPENSIGDRKSVV